MSQCHCKQVFLFPEYHWPHCPFNPHGTGSAAMTKTRLSSGPEVILVPGLGSKQAKRRRVKP